MTLKETPGTELPWAAAHQAVRISMVFGAARGLGIGSVQSSEEEGKALAWRHEP